MIALVSGARFSTIVISCANARISPASKRLRTLSSRASRVTGDTSALVELCGDSKDMRLVAVMIAATDHAAHQNFRTVQNAARTALFYPRASLSLLQSG